MKVSAKITYKHPNRIDRNLDNQITAAMEAGGFRFWASGLNFKSGVRDLAFDMDVPDSP